MVMPITGSRERKRGRTTASGEKERESYVERKVRKFNEGLKADAQSSSHAQSTSKVDVQKLKNLAFTLADRLLTPTLENLLDTKKWIVELDGAAKKLDEVLKVDARDHEAWFYWGRVHFKIALHMELPPLGDVQRKVPQFHHSLPMYLDRTQDLLNKVNGYSEISDKELSDSSDPVLMPYKSVNMRDYMIQGAVEKLLEAMSILPNDNNRNVVDKLANQIYFSPWTGNNQVDECREGLLASAKDAKEALAQHPRDAPKLKEVALALILLRERLTREVEDANVTETRLHDAITMLEEVLMIHPNDCEATLYLGKGHYYLWLDSTLHLDSFVRETYRRKAIECFSAVRDKATTSVMVSEAENLLDTLYERRHREDNYNHATDENVMLMKFVGLLFEAMSLGTYQRCKVAGEKSVKDHLLVHELTSLRRQVDRMLMKLSKSP